MEQNNMQQTETQCPILVRTPVHTFPDLYKKRTYVKTVLQEMKSADCTFLLIS